MSVDGRPAAAFREPLRLGAYGVHVLTASGIVFLLLAAAELCLPEPRAWFVFAMFLGAVVTDAIDGPLARSLNVKRNAAAIDGRTIDDIVDHIGFTFLPLVMIWRFGWVPDLGGVALPRVAWIALPAVCSLLGFAHRHAKDEAAGFFRGFPSYWNIAAFYAGLLAFALPGVGPWVNAVVLLALAVLTVPPVWFLYPNLTPKKYKPLILGGGGVWALLLLAMLAFYPDVPLWLTLLSLVYPLIYTVLSVGLRDRWPARRDFRPAA